MSLLPFLAIARVPGALWVTTFWSFAYQLARAGESVSVSLNILSSGKILDLQGVGEL